MFKVRQQDEIYVINKIIENLNDFALIIIMKREIDIVLLIQFDYFDINFDSCNVQSNHQLTNHQLKEFRLNSSIDDSSQFIDNRNFDKHSRLY